MNETGLATTKPSFPAQRNNIALVERDGKLGRSKLQAADLRSGCKIVARCTVRLGKWAVLSMVSWAGKGRFPACTIFLPGCKVKQICSPLTGTAKDRALDNSRHARLGPFCLLSPGTGVAAFRETKMKRGCRDRRGRRNRKWIARVKGAVAGSWIGLLTSVRTGTSWVVLPMKSLPSDTWHRPWALRLPEVVKSKPVRRKAASAFQPRPQHTSRVDGATLAASLHRDFRRRNDLRECHTGI